jgi:hypothetical protein
MGKAKTQGQGQADGKTLIDCRKLVEIPGFTDEYHDVYDPAIDGQRRVISIKHTLCSKATRPKRSDFIKFNPSIGAIMNKVASWDVGLGCMLLPEVFPCPEIVLICAENYDEERKTIVNKNNQEEILAITQE